MHRFQIFPQNPLFYPHIACQTLKYCDFETVKKCRLVCKLWEEEANIILTVKKCPIILEETGHNPSFPYYCNNVIISKNMGADALNLLLTTQVDAINKIQFLEAQNGPWSPTQFSDILQKLPHLKELTLSGNFILPKMSQQNSFQFSLPNLLSLHLNLADDHLQNFANVSFLPQLCCCAPNLCQITCDQTKFSEPGHPQTTIFSKLLFLSVLSVLPSPNNLTYLDLNIDLRDEDIELLQSAGFLLKSLHLPITSVTSLQKVDSLLASLNSTLKKLKITYRSSTIQLPALENISHLNKLAVHGTGSEVMGLDNGTRYRRRSSFGIGFGPTHQSHEDYSSQSNSTESYKYTDIDLDLDQTIYYIFRVKPSPLFPKGGVEVPLTQLTELQLKSVYYIPRDVFHLRKLFPGLRQLKMSFLDDNLLQAVIQGFPQLETLAATEGFYSDTVMTGISPEVQDLLKNFKISQAYDTQRLVEFPCLGYLSNLRSLELGSPRVTSFGVINGVCLCSSVTEFILNFPQMDDNSLLCFGQNSKWDSVTVKAGSFSANVLSRMKTQMSNQRRKFDYIPNKN